MWVYKSVIRLLALAICPYTLGHSEKQFSADFADGRGVVGAWTNADGQPRIFADSARDVVCDATSQQRA